MSNYYQPLKHYSRYITNQHEHHRGKTYQEEYRALLKEFNVEFDERYVWD